MYFEQDEIDVMLFINGISKMDTTLLVAKYRID